MARKLPPFAALRAFEAVGRHGNLQEAAAELHISASAVSHQIKALEVYVGVKMFTRSAFGLELTEAGQRYLQPLHEALALIEVATREVSGHGDEGTLTVHLFPSLAQLWLIPLLGDFLASSPNIGVKVMSRPDQANFAGTDIDAAFVYADAPPREPLARHLFDDSMVPVCSPEFQRLHGPFHTVLDITASRLIACVTDLGEWPAWMKAMQIQEEFRPFLTVDTRAQSLQAAQEGIGIAMDRTPYGYVMRSRGLLINPLPLPPVKTGYAYYLTAPRRSIDLQRVRKFTGWISVAVTEMQSALGEDA